MQQERNNHIRQQAFTSLELTKGATPEQRAAFSNELKTIEEFAGYILELTNTQHPAGCEWVKCSDRLPGHKKRVKWRDGDNPAHVTDGEISLFEMEKPNLEGWEWYEESTDGNLTQSRADLIREANNRDLDGVGKNTNEFVEILDNALAAGMEVLDELRKNNSENERWVDAVAFAEWIREQNYKPYAGSWYLNGNNYAHQPMSTRNLYNEYQKQNNG
jgi:hypothetical protein